MEDSIQTVLKECGVKASHQRCKIYEYLIEKRNHPTAEKVFRDLHGEIPTLSKTTVYNTLHLFASKGLLQEIHIDDNETRFDADTSVHGHFRCTRCGKVYDFEVHTLETDLLESFSVACRQINYLGLCPNCQK